MMMAEAVMMAVMEASEAALRETEMVWRSRG